MPGPLPSDLRELQQEIVGYAKEFGLDFFETIFEMIDYDEMNTVAARTGFPIRYPHWKFGMEYEALSKSYEYGLSKIYEMVINTDPSYAYLLRGNEYVTQKLVMAHVYGHVDFFKNNMYFGHTNRKMVDEMANHATRIRRYIDKHGLEKVEAWLDACLSIENLIDYHAPAIKRRTPRSVEDERDPDLPGKLPAKEYMDEYINPREFLDAQRRRLEQEAERERKIPPEPEKDILRFLVEFAPLEPWERDVLHIVRKEAYYFAPQAMTKIMNEGWASYWHSRIMTEKAMKPDEFVDYADQNAGVLATSPGRLNPYKLGVELWRNIAERWDKGKFGKEYDDCDDYETLKHWNKDLGLGQEKIFEVRRLYCDLTFIDEFLTSEFCREQKLFVYAYNKNSGYYEIKDRAFKKIKQKLLFQLTNFGHPFIYVADANYENRAELLLLHKHEGVDLDYGYARDTMANIQRIWRRPVNLETQVDGKKVLLTYDGKEHSEKELEQLTLL